MLPPAPEQRAQEGETPVSMASANGGETHGDATAATDDGGDRGNGVKSIQSHYLRCPSPSNLSMLSESRFSMISGSDAESIFMEPIHLSSAIAAKQIINEELPSRGVQAQSVPESMLETPEQLMVEDLYNRVKDMIDDRSPYNTPCVLDIQRAMVQDRLESPINPVDEVWPSIFIAEKSVAVNKARLKRMGITHILNAAHGTGVYTGESFYAGMNIHYMGIEVDDFNDADISPHFRTTAEFLDDALLTHKGKVLVVSMLGVSRSAVLVASYLMIFQHMSIMEALTALRKKRPVNPNEGFLKQLRQLNESLMEERDDDDDTLSQCSVIDARARARIFGTGVVEEDEEEEEEDTDEEEERSMVGVKAHSIMMEEEEDGASVMSSVASSAGALRSGYDAAERRRAARESRGGEAPPPLPLLPPRNDVQGGDEVVEDDGGGGGDDDAVGGMVREWQRRNEKYQSEEWWQAQLDSDGEEDADSLPEPGSAQVGKGEAGDLESITSEDVRAVKECVRRRNRRPPSTSASATSGASSYADLWRQRLREIEEQAVTGYRKREEGEDDVVGADGGDSSASGTRAKKKIDEDVESLLSDTSSMYTFCQRNKEKLTPLERWRVKRIQFGWNKKDGEEGGGPGGDGSSVAGGKGGEGAPPEARSPSLEEVNLTAYQTWKLKQQRRLGEENKDEILELSRGEDSATAKRRQRREELLERSRKTLEESQSMCGWETESSVSAGTIPLSAFWAGAGVTGPTSVANDDNVSMLSGRSSVISSVSQPRGARSGPHPVPSLPPMVPIPTMQGPGGEPMVNLASIQNWIANVVSETIMQKQSEMSLPPPSQAGSVLGFGGTPSLLSGRGGEFDKASLLSGGPYCSAPPLGRATTTRAESVLSGGGSSRISGSSSLASKKTKITTTSVPLFSLFQDQVDLGKLDSMDKEMKSEMRDKMATYERKKILEDNKRSTLFKKKKPKEDEDEEEEEERKKKEEEFLKENSKKAEKPKRSYGLSGCLNLNPALEKDKNTSIDDWLKSVRPPPKKTTSSLDADGPATGVSVVEDPYDDLDGSASEFGFPGHVRNPGEEEYSVTSSPNHPYRGARSQLDSEFSSNGFTQSHSCSLAGRSYGERDEGAESFSAKRKLGNNRFDTGRVDRTEVGGNEEDEVSAFIAQTRQRIRARAAAEAEDDEVLVAWRAQQEAKSQSRNES